VKSGLNKYGPLPILYWVLVLVYKKAGFERLHADKLNVYVFVMGWAPEDEAFG